MTIDGHTVPRTGNGFIDVTHVALMDRVDTIRRACANGASQEAVAPHFGAFVDEMRAHFDNEEVIIRAVGFDRWEDHAHQHSLLDQQIGRLVDYVRECDVSNAFMCTVAGTLDAVLCRHEIRHDSDYAKPVRDASSLPGARALILWEPGFEVGVASVDAEHRDLVGQINELHRMAVGNAPEAEAMGLLETAHDAVRSHFASEETTLRAFAPARFLSHRDHHVALEAQFAGIRRDIETARLDLGVAVRDFLRFWLIDHVVNADRDAFAAG